MAAKGENGVKASHKTDIWRSNNTCMICQDCCPSREDKDKHESQTKHKKKLLVYEFFAKEIPKFGPFSGSSVLLKRYTACGERVVGLECVHELHFSFTVQPWWACSICYESGALMEQADAHLTSMSHITTYLDEFHSSKIASLHMDGDRLEVFKEIRRLCDVIVEEQGGELLPPECLVMDAGIVEKEAMAKLAIDAERLKPSYRLHTDCLDEAHPRKILQCTTCHQLVAVNDELLKRIWNTHELSPAHRHAAAIEQFLEQFDVEYVLDVDVPEAKSSLSVEWKTENGCSYGPVCGIKFLVSFNKHSFCQLCCCEVESIERHFSSENHIMQYLTISNPVEMFRVSQYPRESRMARVLELLKSPKFAFGNEQSRKVHIDWFPKDMKILLKPESHEFPSLMPPLTPLGIDSSCLFCTVCWLAVCVKKDAEKDCESYWNAHCIEPSHFDFAVRRAAFGFHDDCFVPMSTSVPKASWNLHGSWKAIKEDDDEFYIQTQSDVGLEFVVDDQENLEVVCTLCARWYPRGMHEKINNHIRSFQHLSHYLHATNRNLLSMVMVQKTEAASRELALEWLKRSIHHDMDEMRVYSPEMAQKMKHWGTIPMRKVDVTGYDSAHRPLVECIMDIVDTVADDGAELAEMPIKDALNASGVKIHALKERNGAVERILCRCTQCEMAFSTTVEGLVENVWDRHLSSDQHFGRLKAFMNTKLDMLGFSESTSSYTVKPFKQQDPSRKVTWQWNAKDKAHEFVLNVVGLPDLVERRSNEASGAHPPDFFCRLCAVVIPRRSAALEAHVRSAQHILCYVHKYHPLTIMELDSLPKEGGKEMRKILAQLLKDHQLKDQYCIPIYDPIGEQERKGIVAMQRAKEEERQRNIAEARQKAQELRKKKDEERRKQRELELEQEKQRMAERARKEKEARERAKRLEEEKAHVKKLLLEAARKAEEERKAKEAKEQAKEEADRQKRQEQLRSLLDREKARLRALQEKEAAQRRLLVEKQELEKKMRELQEQRASSQGRPPNMHQPPLMTAPLYPEPQLVHPNMKPPSNFGGPPQESFRQPLLGQAPPMAQNGSGFAVPHPPVSFALGTSIPPPREPPKPLFPKFVPIGERVPVYNGPEDTEKPSRIKPASPVNVRPSLAERRVDPYISNAKIIQTRDQLVDFIWRQGAERIPPNELPVQFNEKAAGIEGALGVDCLYEVVCADCSDLDTFYCSMCGVWTTPSEMFKHLETVGHKLAYLFRNYKMYHKTVVSESNALVREAMLSQFAIQIWKMEKPPGQVANRLRSLLDRATIERIWPEHVLVLDHSWKGNGKTVGRVEVPPPISKEAWSFMNDEASAEDREEKESEKKHKEEKKSIKKEGHEKSDSQSKRKDTKDKKSPSDARKPSPAPAKETRKSEKTESPARKRRRSKSPEKHSRTTDRSRARSSSRSKRTHHRRSSKETSKRSRSRSRSRSRRTRKRSKSRDSSRGHGHSDKKLSWEETAAAFLAKLGDPKAAAKVLVSKTVKQVPAPEKVTSKSFVDEKIKQLRNLAAPVPSTSKEKPEPHLQSESDEKAQMRKLLGVLITMQQEAEKSGNLDDSVIDKLYREVGLKKSNQTTSDQLLAQICAEIMQGSQSTSKPAIDLQSFGISAQPAQPTPSYGGGMQSQAVPQSNQQSTIQMLLSEVKRSLGNLQPARAQSPLIKSPPFVITNRDDVFPNNESVSYVFPGTDSKELRHDSDVGASRPEENLSKKEKAALRKKKLLEEAERLRRQAEEEDGDDDDEWDCLAEVINRPPEVIREDTSRNHAQKTRESPAEQRPDEWSRDPIRQSRRSRKTANERERSRDRRSDEKDNGDRAAYSGEKLVRRSRDEETSKVIDKRSMQDDELLDPRQKMPLRRTILPDGSAAESKRKEEKPAKEQKKKVERLPMDYARVGNPMHWPQPVPQPLLGLNLEPPRRDDSPRRKEPSPQVVRPTSPHSFPVGNQPVYPTMGGNVYPNQYPPVYAQQQQLPYHNPPFYPEPQMMSQPPMVYGAPPMQPQYFDQQPYYY